MAITNATRLAGYVGAAITGNGPDGSISLLEVISDDISVLTLSASSDVSVDGHLTGTGATFTGNVTGVAATFSGNVTVGGTLTYDDVTNIDSVGLITARNGLQVLAGITTISGQANLANVNVSGASTFTGGLVDVQSSGVPAVISHWNSAKHLQLSTGDNGGGLNITDVNYFAINHQPYADRGTTNNLTERLRITTAGNAEFAGGIDVDGHTELDDVNVSGVSTFSGKINANAGVGFTGFLREGINIVSGKLSDNTTINIDHSMVHYFTTAESTTGIPNFTSTAGINTDLSVGETFSVNVITTAAAAGYSTGARIDAGATLPVLWNGGSDPSTGGSSGVDVYTYQVIKTASATFTVLGNVSNFA